MFNYDFESNKEKAIFENRNVILEINNNEYNLCMLITNKNILLFNDVNKNNVLNTRGMYMPPEYLLEMKLPISKISYVVEEGNTYIDYKDDTVVIYNFDLEKYI